VIGSNVFAATANSVANRAGAVYSRDSASTQWSLALDGTEKEAVVVGYLNAVYAFQGENDGRPATVSALNSSTGAWTEIAYLGSMVPTSALSYMGEAWVGGRSNASAGGPAKLFHGNGVTFTEQKVPVQPFIGQIASVPALCEANGTLFVAVEIRDANSGATTGGNLFYLDPVKGLVGINQMQNDAPVSLAAADGTIYCGTRAGKLEWLDEKGKWNVETSLPANLGVTALAWNGMELELGVRSLQGAELLVRTGMGAVPPPPSTSGLTFTSVSPATGDPAGGTAVTIMGKGFADVTLVKVGGVPLTGLKVVSDIQLTGTTPAGTAGAADIVITSMSKGSTTAKGAFTYKAAGPATLSYATDILKILNKAGVDKCTGCHVTGVYPLTPYATLLAGKGANGTPYVVKGNVAASYLAQKIDITYGMTAATSDMAVHVTAAEKQTIETWIQQGANP